MEKILWSEFYCKLQKRLICRTNHKLWKDYGKTRLRSGRHKIIQPPKSITWYKSNTHEHSSNLSFSQVVTKLLSNHIELVMSHWFAIEKTKAWVVFSIVTPPAPHKSSYDSIKDSSLGTKKKTKAKDFFFKRVRDSIESVMVPSSLELHHLALLWLPCTFCHRRTIPLEQAFQAQINRCWCHWFPQGSSLQLKQR